jgi:hypothetical protein
MNTDHFSSLEIETIIDSIILPMGFCKAARSWLPHANYSLKMEKCSYYVSLLVETERTPITDLSPEFLADPVISLSIGANSVRHRTKIDLPIFKHLLHSDALKAISFLRPSLHWLFQLTELKGFFNFIR